MKADAPDLSQPPASQDEPAHTPPSALEKQRASAVRRGLGIRGSWGPTRIRGKLIFLHTTFSLALAVALLLALHPPVRDLVFESEARACRLALELYSVAPEKASSVMMDGSRFARGSAAELRLDPVAAEQARANPGEIVIIGAEIGEISAIRWDSERSVFQQASVRITEAHAAVNRLYLILTIALLTVYALIALTLEVFVLPKQVYHPIETLRRADEAVQAGDRELELIRESQIPRDEIGQIMRSRNLSIMKLRTQEEALEEALGKLEVVASELKRKNHLLEMARRNLADQDRLASLGMMSAGIAHELNTPLAVIKGCVEELAAREGRGLSPERVALMGRVVRRLERLSESLLDFARAREPAFDSVSVHEIIEEAWTLVSLDRDAARVRLDNRVDPALQLTADGDRLTQVFVNLLRNAVDAMEGTGAIVVAAEIALRDDRRWVSITVADSGPGIDPVLFPRMFEPFASTRMDSHGTGLGLAVAEGIVREHGGLLLARNASAPDQGAIFEIMLPRHAGSQPGLFGEDGADVEDVDATATLAHQSPADFESDAQGAGA